MSNKLRLEIVAPDRNVYSGDVDEVYFPGNEGVFGVLNGHMNMLSSLTAGEVAVFEDGKEVVLTIDKGFCEINSTQDQSVVTVLVENVAFASEIDVEEAIRRKVEAEAILQNLNKEDLIKFKMAEAQLMRAIADIQAANKVQRR